jgi:hypothetical protein
MISRSDIPPFYLPQENCKVCEVFRDTPIPHTSPKRKRGTCGDSPSLAFRASGLSNLSLRVPRLACPTVFPALLGKPAVAPNR